MKRRIALNSFGSVARRGPKRLRDPCWQALAWIEWQGLLLNSWTLRSDAKVTPPSRSENASAAG
jgi:hypothetical protein